MIKPDVENIEEQYIVDIAQALLNKSASVMVGAGFSKNSKYHNSKKNKMLSWYELADKFYRILYGNKDESKEYLNPLVLAEEVEIMYGRNKLNNIIVESLPDMDHAPSKIHYELLNLPWKDIFTTNYDTLLERASEDIIKNDYEFVNNKEGLINSSMNARIVKLHGSFPSHTPFIITEEDYRTYPKNYAPFVNTVQQALLENTFCMIGFSGTDPNFLNWLGWLSDNYNNIVPQKIYMISASGENKIQKEKLSSKNIVILDLKKMWPEIESREERINEFLLYLNNKLEKEESKIEWLNGDSKDILIQPLPPTKEINKDEIRKYTNAIKNLISTYPGWIVLPKEYKDKNTISFILTSITSILYKFKNTDIELIEVINYIYEYVIFLDICGRPIFKKEINIIVNVLNKLKDKEGNQKSKIVIIKLMTLRSYRELGFKDEFYKLMDEIDKDILDEYYINFLKYEECMIELYSLNLVNYKEKVLKWNVDIYDHYWMLRRISLMAEFGDYNNCKRVLMNTLNNLRKIKYKKLNNEFIRNQSIEECIVNLINYINQSIQPFNKKHQYEKTEITNKIILKNEFNWFQENRYYIKSFEYKYIREPNTHSSLSFKLGSITNKTSFTSDNKEVLEAFDYLRFREETGMPFIMGNVKNKKYLLEVIRRIVDYNPNLAFIIYLKSNEYKSIDYIYGRKYLSGITCQEADEEVIQFIDLINEYLLEEIDEENYFMSKNIYDYFANLLPEVISRLIMKCSLKIRDKALQLSLNIYKSKKLKNFRNMNKLISELINMYTYEEIISRMSLILDFPILIKELGNEYPDPITYVLIDVNNKKSQLNNDEYQKIIDNLNLNQKNISKERIQRIILFFLLINFNKQDKEVLEHIIWADYKPEQIPVIEGFNHSILLELPHSKYITKNELENSIKIIYLAEIKKRKPLKKGVRSIGIGFNYKLNLVDDLITQQELKENDMREILDFIIYVIEENLTDLNYPDILESYSNALYNIRRSDQLITKLLLKSNKVSDIILEKIKYLFKLASKKEISLINLRIMYNLYSDYTEDILNIVTKGILYNRDKEFLDIIRAFNNIASTKNINISDNLKIEWLKLIFTRISISSFEDDNNIIIQASDIIKKLDSEFIDVISEYIIILLDKSLNYVIIEENDDEQSIIYKITYKSYISELVNILYNKEFKKGEKLKEMILRWKKLCEDENEFIEIRKPWLEQ
ncbi:SIR2 family protein [Senegalia sp. (in: firmicutes)]|uniref:SIR2 family protein n=1 Tax=Senegalia sp. (in: firmicutes) TaxID=1924098 RepID=UPI003F9C0E7C